jgi:hypothetical protein
MKFETNNDDFEPVIFAVAYTSRICNGDQVATVRRANVCEVASNAASMQLVTGVPQNCVIEIYRLSEDCTGESYVYAAPGSTPGCYKGINLQSIKLVCAT